MAASWTHDTYGSAQLRVEGSTCTVIINGVQVVFNQNREISSGARTVLARFLTHLAAATGQHIAGYRYTKSDSLDVGALTQIALNNRPVINHTTDGNFIVHADYQPPSEPFSRPPTAAQIERAVMSNSFYRHVLYTAPDRSLQMVAMSVDPIIPREAHDDTAQYFLVKHGRGLIEVDTQPESIDRASARWVMPKQEHIVCSLSPQPLKLFVTYVPAHHPSGRVDEFNVDLLK